MELGQDVRNHVHAIGRHQLGWQVGPTQCQCIMPAGRLAIDSPIHYRMARQS